MRRHAESLEAKVCSQGVEKMKCDIQGRMRRYEKVKSAVTYWADALVTAEGDFERATANMSSDAQDAEAAAEFVKQSEIEVAELKELKRVATGKRIAVNRAAALDRQKRHRTSSRAATAVVLSWLACAHLFIVFAHLLGGRVMLAWRGWRAVLACSNGLTWARPWLRLWYASVVAVAALSFA